MSNIETVKCVIVGDVLTGKSSFLLKVTTNEVPEYVQPTVIDNVIHDLLLPNGKLVVLSFWDASGSVDYDGIRSTCVYPETDVLLVCFSVDNSETFHNVRSKWIPEITYHCPCVPWLLVGMKCDLRIAVHEIQNPPNRQFRIDQGICMVERTNAIELAQQYGVDYYECSAICGIGIVDVLNGVAMTGLGLVKKKSSSLSLWKRNKRKIEIFVPPSPPVMDTKTPNVDVPVSTLQSEWLKMVNNECLSDVQFHYKADCYHGHKIVLCSASELFRRIFEIGGRLEEDNSSRCDSWDKKRLKAINRQCINNGAIEAFKNIYDKDNVTVITVNDDNMTKVAFEKCLSFLYGGCADVKDDGDLEDIVAAAELMNLPKLIRVCANVKNHEEFLNPCLTKEFASHNAKIMERLFFNKTLCSDITFVVDGRKIPAHHLVLTARCEVLSVMFSGKFSESINAEAKIPGIDLGAFMAFLQYLYGDHCPLEREATTILVLANKYCVDRLRALCELHISEVVEKASEASIAKGKLDVIDLLLNAQLHNADQLSGFLLRFVASHFQLFEKTKQFQRLTGENLLYVKEHQSLKLSEATVEEQREKDEDEKENKHLASNTNNSTISNPSTAKDNCVIM